MAQPDAVLDLVFDELERAAAMSETRSRAALQAACGLGAGDLNEALDALRSQGRITEEAPDEFVTLSEDDDAPARDLPPDADPPPPAAANTQRSGVPGPRAAAPQSRENKRVELTAAVATAIGPEGLGNLVTAGIKEASGAGVSFVFEVVP